MQKMNNYFSFIHNKKIMTIIERTCIVVSVLIFYLCASLFIFIRSNIFPIINAAILLSFVFLFNGKYRLYMFVFFIPASKCMTLINTNIGSFLTWSVFIYFIICVLERVFKKQYFGDQEIRILLAYCLFAFSILFSNVVNIKHVSLLKFASYFLYLSIPFLFIIDNKAKKDTVSVIIFFSLSHLATNVFAFSFLYVFKEHAIDFLNAYIPAYVKLYNVQTLSAFRYPGIKGDSNHNGLYILISTALLLFPIRTKKGFVRYLSALIAVSLQPFALIGGSKTYLVGIIAVAVLAIFLFSKSVKQAMLVFSIAVLFSSVGLLIIIQMPVFSKALSRFLYTDTRAGFLESITTFRASLWIQYLSESFKNPFSLVIGHGSGTNHLFGSDNYHNAAVQMYWEFGIVGSITFFHYLNSFLRNSFNKKNIEFLMVVLILIIFAFSLHIIYDEAIYASIFVLYLIKKRSILFRESEVNI